MNRILRPSDFANTTQAAEGLPRRRWTVAEIEAMVEAGIIEEDERFELIGGDVVPMSPKGLRHETLKMELNRIWTKRIPPEFRLIPETTFRLNVDSFVEPDFVFFKTSDGLKNLRPATCLLAVEIADSSLGFDLGRKAKLYASFGIVEVWVIDARRRETHVMSNPSGGVYDTIDLIPPTLPIAPSFAPNLAVALGRVEDLES